MAYAQPYQFVKPVSVDEMAAQYASTIGRAMSDRTQSSIAAARIRADAMQAAFENASKAFSAAYLKALDRDSEEKREKWRIAQRREEKDAEDERARQRQIAINERERNRIEAQNTRAQAAIDAANQRASDRIQSDKDLARYRAEKAQALAEDKYRQQEELNRKKIAAEAGYDSWDTYYNRFGTKTAEQERFTMGHTPGQIVEWNKLNDQENKLTLAFASGEIDSEQFGSLMQQVEQSRSVIASNPQPLIKPQSPYPEGKGVGDSWTEYMDDGAGGKIPVLVTRTSKGEQKTLHVATPQKKTKPNAERDTTAQDNALYSKVQEDLTRRMNPDDLPGIPPPSPELVAAEIAKRASIVGAARKVKGLAPDDPFFADALSAIMEEPMPGRSDSVPPQMQGVAAMAAQAPKTQPAAPSPDREPTTLPYRETRAAPQSQPATRPAAKSSLSSKKVGEVVWMSMKDGTTRPFRIAIDKKTGAKGLEPIR